MAGEIGPKRIVILGGGFGGVYAARHLEDLLKGHRDVEVTLVSRENYLLMTPLLFEAGSGVLEPRHAVNPIRPLFERVRFVEAEITGVDLDAKLVYARPTLDERYELPYDHLVFALGGVTNRAIIPGSEHAMSFKTLADAIFLRNYVIELFERADVERDEKARRQLLTFAVIGGGLVGVELMGELTDFTRHLCREYPRVDPKVLTFHLIEAGPKVMAEMDRDLADYAIGVLRKRGVNVRTSSPVAKIDPTCVYLPGGETIDAETIVLAAGVAPNPMLKNVGVEKTKGRVAVDATLRSTSHPAVWALGDCAFIPDPDGKPYPMLAQHALREARVLAENLAATFSNKPLKKFEYRTMGTLAALGHYKGVGRVMRMKFRGFLAWWIWRSYYLLQMPQWSRRVRIMIDWTIALFFKNDVVKLDLFGEEHPLRKFEEQHLKQKQVAAERIG